VPRLADPTAWRDVLAVHRLEFPFPVNYLCYATCGACFAAGDAARLLDLPALAAIIANLLLIVAGLALNTAADVRTDERHHERHHLAQAARRIGTARLVRWVVAELTVALLLACLAAAAAAGRPLVAVTAVVIVVLQVLYNVEPVRLKRRGLTGVAAFCTAVLVLPFLLSYWVVRPDVDAASWLVVAGLGALSVGRMTSWSVPDRDADAATGLGTPAVRYGAAGALVRSVVVMIVGLVVTGWGLWWRFGPLWAVPLVALQGTFVLAQLRRGTDLASPRHIRHRVMPPATIAAVALTVVPLIAP
jgi:lycopene elongase/hydratase (dihydrobisanhydrobacterioruberin-forming)